jgi:amino-acid N-acetyltransferase
MRIRPAILSDVAAIHALVVHYAAKGLLLARNLDNVVGDIDSFIVCEDAGTVVGCLSLVEYHAGLAEIRSVAVEPSRASSGIGSRLVRNALQLAAARGIARVLAVTGTPEFFVRFGFEASSGEAMSEKIERDCRGCTKARACALVPMIAAIETESVRLPFSPHVNCIIAAEC